MQLTDRPRNTVAITTVRMMAQHYRIRHKGTRYKYHISNLSLHFVSDWQALLFFSKMFYYHLIFVMWRLLFVSLFVFLYLCNNIFFKKWLSWRYWLIAILGQNIYIDWNIYCFYLYFVFLLWLCDVLLYIAHKCSYLIV